MSEQKRVCCIRKKPLTEDEEGICDSCHTAEMKRDIEIQTEELEAEHEQYDESWRFRDSRGRSVFKREL